MKEEAKAGEVQKVLFLLPAVASGQLLNRSKAWLKENNLTVEAMVRLPEVNFELRKAELVEYLKEAIKLGPELLTHLGKATNPPIATDYYIQGELPTLELIKPDNTTVCAERKKPASLVCGTCKDAPTLKNEKLGNAHHCSTDCQKKHCLGGHKKKCLFLEVRKLLYRAGTLLQEVFDKLVTKIETRGGKIYIYKGNYTRQLVGS